MLTSLRLPSRPATLFQRFMLASLLILIASMLGIGVWVGNEIRNGVRQMIIAAPSAQPELAWGPGIHPGRQSRQSGEAAILFDPAGPCQGCLTSKRSRDYHTWRCGLK